jgi:exonuclease III
MHITFTLKHCNVNGIRSQQSEKINFFNNADAISIQDTRTKDGTDILTTLFPQFQIYEFKHGAQCGVALLINNKINHKLISKQATDCHVLITVEINDIKYFPFPFYISTLYVPPLNARHGTHSFNTTLLSQALQYKYAILIGDLIKCPPLRHWVQRN